MNSTWRLLDTGALPAATNMALDKVILNARSQNLIPNTVRFLEFSPHCALVGYHQAVELEVEEEYCRRKGIEINRRITGGGNIYLDEGQLGWELFAPRESPGIPKRLDDMYRLLCESAIAGLKRLGVRADFRPANDIEVNGRKISGTGGTEFGDVFLYHGTVLTNFDVDTMVKALKLPIKKLEDKQVQGFKNRVTCLKEVLGYLPPMDEIKKAMAEGFAEILGVNLVRGALTDEEESMLDKELPYFQSSEWIYGLREHPRDSELCRSEYKSTGGLIQVSLRLDRIRKIIKYAFITGDFFAYPERAILDLEAALKNTSYQREDLEQTVKIFFHNNNVTIPGAGPDDFIKALLAAIDYSEISRPAE